MTDKDESLLAALGSVLDEALLDLRENDRAALLSRFAQERSLKEVGASLGVSEDTAQKRVAKAIEHLTDAFRRRGYKVPTAAVTLAVLEGAAHSAPAGLIATATAAGLAASATYNLGTFAILASKIMSLTKTQTATVCLLLGTAPVAYQWQVNQQARAEQQRAERTVSEQANILAGLEERRAALARQNILAENELAVVQAELNRAISTPAPVLPPEEELYTWSDDATHVRLPKGLLNELRLTTRRELPGANGEMIVGRREVLDENGVVSPVLLEALGLDGAQMESVQGAFINFAQRFEDIEQAHTHQTNLMPPGVSLDRAKGSAVVTLRTVAFPEAGARLREELENHLTAEIGAERTDIILNKQAAHDLQTDFLDFGKLDNWMAAVQMPDGRYGIAKAKSRDGVSTGGSASSGFPYEHLPAEIKKILPPPAVEPEP
jgi:hypothetical protein